MLKYMSDRNVLRRLQNALTRGEAFSITSAQALVIKPTSDDTGAVHFGTGTEDLDVKIFVGANTDFALFDVGNGQLTLDSMELQMGDADKIEFGDGVDLTMAWDGTDFDVLAAADDSVIKFGNGTNSFDIWLFGQASGEYLLWDASDNKLISTGNAFVAKKVTALTSNTVLSTAQMGGIITNRGTSGALNHTLPAITSPYLGAWFQYFGVADQTQTFTADPADTLIAFNDATADSIAFSTAGEKIGAHATFVCDGTSWIVADVKGAATVAT